MKVLIEPEAEAEIEAAAAWYQLEAPGLGNEFLRAVQAAIAALGRQPCDFRHCLRAEFAALACGASRGVCFTKLMLTKLLS